MPPKHTLGCWGMQQYYGRQRARTIHEGRTSMGHQRGDSDNSLYVDQQDKIENEEHHLDRASAKAPKATNKGNQTQ